MNPFEMVVAIICIVTVGKVLQAKFGGGRHRRGSEGYAVRDDSAVAAENHRLKGEIASLKGRVQVLERVITDNESSLRLDHEIEKLRDKSRTEI